MVHSFSFLTDRKGRLSAASGDTDIAGVDGAHVDARPLFALFADHDKDVVANALREATPQEEIDLPGLRVLSGGSEEAVFDITIQPAGPDKFWVLFAPATGQVSISGPIAKENFLSAVAERLGLPGAPDMQMVMFDFEALRDAELQLKIGDDGIQEVRASIESVLTEAAVDGQVGRLDATSYGVLGPVDQDKAEVVATVVDAAEKLGVSKTELGATAERVELDAEEGVDAEGLRDLLSHAAHKFYQTVRNGTPFGAEKLSEVSEEIQKAILLIENALERGDITVTSRDVHRITDGDVSMCLAHGALVFGDEAVTADRLLVMDNHPTLCGKHDRAIAATAAETTPTADRSTTIIVDIALPTLETGEASRIAADMAAAGYKVGFRPHGVDISASRSKGTRQVYQLLNDGVPVWLMNFSTAISKTRRLRGAYVEVSAILLRDLSNQPDRNKLLARFLKVWQEVEVRLVAVNVDSKNLASFMNKLGIAYGVGIAADPAADAPQSTRDVAS